MPRTAPLSAAFIFIGGLLWAGRVLFGSSPWGTAGATLVAADLIVLTAATVVALLLSPGRWVRNSAAVIGGSCALLAIALPIGPVWVAAVVTCGTGVGLTWTRPMDAWFRQVRPDRVPTRATVLALGLLWLPAVVGSASIPAVTRGGWLLAGFGLIGGWAYARALPGALWTIRLTLAPLGILSAAGVPLPAAVALWTVTAILTFLAWTGDAGAAVRTPRARRVETVTILPEVTPGDLLEAAGYDRRGRPLEGSD